MAMNIFDLSEVWFFSTRFQLYQFLIALPAILDNFSHGISLQQLTCSWRSLQRWIQMFVTEH